VGSGGTRGPADQRRKVERNGTVRTFGPVTDNRCQSDQRRLAARTDHGNTAMRTGAGFLGLVPRPPG
jgi:hypothetical protein